MANRRDEHRQGSVNQNTKQRIVGTVVLLALALIFLPVLFDGEGSYQRPVSSRIPDAPAVNRLAEPVAERVIPETPPPPVVSSLEPSPAVPDQQPADPEAEFVVAAAPVALEPETQAGAEPQLEVDSVAAADGNGGPVLDAEGLPVGWSVRLASFADERNAQTLLQRLLQDEFKAYSRQITTEQGAMTAVFVGPQLERDRVEALKAQLQDRYQLNGIVVRFEIEAL